MEANVRPLRADAARNRARVLDAARSAFAEAGLDVGVEEIARRAGVGKGTLYRRFPTKEALVRAIFASLTAITTSPFWMPRLAATDPSSTSDTTTPELTPAMLISS